jgi:hypothetical protein
MLLLNALRGLSRDERGFSMPAVLGTMTVLVGVSLMALTTASGDQSQSRYDQDYKRAYSAAEAGVNEYLFRLNEDQAYWAQCADTNDPAPVNQPWSGTGPDTRTERRNIPGSDAQYTIELLPQVGTSCDPNNPAAMMDTRTGTFRIRSTGFAGRAKRSIVATFRRRGFLDFLYYTDLETANPVSYRINAGGYPPSEDRWGNPYEDPQTWASRECSKPFAQRANAETSIRVHISSNNRPTVVLRCTEISFITGDGIDGPLHTNDQLFTCGSPIFGRNIDGIRDPIEVVNPTGYRRSSSCSGSPNFVGERRFGAPRLDAPPVVSLRAIAASDEDALYIGRTQIELMNGLVRITNNNVTKTIDPPDEGVIYVANGSGSCGFYDPTQTHLTYPACGDVTVRGTYSADLTIAAEKDVQIVGNVQRADGSNAMLGLIAQNFIRVAHPVRDLTREYSNSAFRWECDNNGTPPKRVDAAMLAIDHSFTVDNYYCGNPLGDLTVNGAIAQKYRGTVGTFSGNTPVSGFSKDYHYDDRLKYRQPPHFLDPIQTGWRVIRQTEQTPAR